MRIVEDVDSNIEDIEEQAKEGNDHRLKVRSDSFYFIDCPDSCVSFFVRCPRQLTVALTRNML